MAFVPESLAPPISHGRGMPSTLFFGAPGEFQFTRNADGSAQVHGLKVFKAGTFNDSKRVRRTWTAEHLEQMVYNFHLLKQRQLFTDVPVRQDHTEGVKDIGGYINDLHTDGEYLYATLDVTEPDFAGKIDRRTYRARSSEIGMYEANDESIYWPVLRGLAFVDIGAVEGLHSAARTFAESVIVDEETGKMPDKPEVHTFHINGKPVTDPAQVQAHVTRLEGLPTQATFKIAGAETDDPKEIQKHIDTLEKFQAETEDTARSDFVNGLVEKNLVAAPKKDKILELVKTFDAEQFEAYKDSFEGAESKSLFGKHGNGDRGKDDQDGNKVDPKEDRMEVLEGVVKMHRQGGMSEELIKQSPSYLELAEMKAAR